MHGKTENHGNVGTCRIETGKNVIRVTEVPDLERREVFSGERGRWKQRMPSDWAVSRVPVSAGHSTGSEQPETA